MKKLTYLIITILSILFGPITLALLLFLFGGSTFNIDLTAKKGSFLQRKFGFFFDKPKESSTKQMFRFCLLQLPVIAILGGFAFFLTIVWTKFVFNDLLGVNIDGFLDSIFSR